MIFERKPSVEVLRCAITSKTLKQSFSQCHFLYQPFTEHLPNHKWNKDSCCVMVKISHHSTKLDTIEKETGAKMQGYKMNASMCLTGTHYITKPLSEKWNESSQRKDSRIPGFQDSRSPQEEKLDSTISITWDIYPFLIMTLPLQSN